MFRHSKRLRPLDPSSSDSEESESADEDVDVDGNEGNENAGINDDDIPAIPPPVPPEPEPEPQEAPPETFDIAAFDTDTQELPEAEEDPDISIEAEIDAGEELDDEDEEEEDEEEEEEDEEQEENEEGEEQAVEGNEEHEDFDELGGPENSFFGYEDSFGNEMFAPPPTPGGFLNRESPQPSTSRESPQPGPSRASQPPPAQAGPSTRSRHEHSTRKSTRNALSATKAPRPITMSAVQGPNAGKGDNAKPDGGNLKSTLRRIYSDLIETCQGYEEKEGLESDLQKIMTDNISEGNRLFEGLKRIGGGPGDMYMAFLHTKMCSQVIRFKSYTIGSATSGFKLDLFISALAADSKNSLNEYSPRLLTQRVSERAADCCTTVPHLSCMIGAFDRDKMSPHKEKKQRAPPRKRVVDQSLTAATQHEEINISQRNVKEPTKSPETLKTEIFKILKNHNRAETSNINLFEFTLDKTSFANSVEYLFYVGFLIRDGFISLARRSDKPGDSGLVIKPDKPPQKSLLRGDYEQPGADVCRNQFILSFSPKLWKTLSAVAAGEDIITKYKSSDI